MQLTKKEAARLGLLEKTEAAPRAKQPRRLATEPPTGLWGLISRGWSIESPDSMRYRLYVINRPEYDTGMQPSELAACLAAKELERCNRPMMS